MATLYDPDNRFVLDGQQGSAIARLPVRKDGAAAGIGFSHEVKEQPWSRRA